MISHTLAPEHGWETHIGVHLVFIDSVVAVLRLSDLELANL